MATSIWPWQRTMLGRVLLTGFMASPRTEKRGTMCREYRTPISGRVQDVLRMPSSTHARSTETLHRTAASYSPTNKRSSRVSAVIFLRFGALLRAAKKFALFLRGIPVSGYDGVAFGGDEG